MGAEAGGSQDVADAIVEALDHAIDLRIARFYEAILDASNAYSRSNTCWPLGSFGLSQHRSCSNAKPVALENRTEPDT